jgi:hypothetical protein
MHHPCKPAIKDAHFHPMSNHARRTLRTGWTRTTTRPASRHGTLYEKNDVHAHFFPYKIAGAGKQAAHGKTIVTCNWHGFGCPQSMAEGRGLQDKGQRVIEISKRLASLAKRYVARAAVAKTGATSNAYAVDLARRGSPACIAGRIFWVL